MNSMVTVQFNSQPVASFGNQMKIYAKKDGGKSDENRQHSAFVVKLQ